MNGVRHFARIIGRQDARPEGHGLDAPDAFRADKAGRFAALLAVAARQWLAGFDEGIKQAEVVVACNIQPAGCVEESKGIGVLAADQLQDTLIHDGDGHLRTGRGGHFHLQVALRPYLLGNGHLDRNLVGEAVHKERDSAKGPARCSRQHVFPLPDQRRGQVNVGTPFLLHRNLDMRGIAGEGMHAVILHAASFHGDQQLAGIGRTDLDLRRIARVVALLVGDQLQTRRIGERPGRISPAAAVHDQLGDRAAFRIGQVHTVGTHARRSHRETPGAVAGGDLLGGDRHRLPHRLEFEAVAAVLHHRLPAVMVERCHQFRMRHLLS